jgi:hypothetical protein
VYLTGVAYECSKSALAAKAIGRLIEAMKAKFPKGMREIKSLYVSRGQKLSYRIETREDRVSADEVVRLAIDVKATSTAIERQVAKLR